MKRIVAGLQLSEVNSTFNERRRARKGLTTLGAEGDSVKLWIAKIWTENRRDCSPVRFTWATQWHVFLFFFIFIFERFLLHFFVRFSGDDETDVLKFNFDIFSCNIDAQSNFFEAKCCYGPLGCFSVASASESMWSRQATTEWLWLFNESEWLLSSGCVLQCWKPHLLMGILKIHRGCRPGMWRALDFQLQLSNSSWYPLVTEPPDIDTHISTLVDKFLYDYSRTSLKPFDRDTTLMNTAFTSEIPFKCGRLH